MEFQFRINFSPSLREDSALPLLFVARMMVIFLVWIRGMETILPPFLPFISGLDSLRELGLLSDMLTWLYRIALVMVFIGFRFRQFALILGGLVFYSIISSKIQFSNSFLYAGCVLFLIGLHRPGLDWIFRIQLAILYLGAGLNKVLDPDWLSGQYFDHFFSEQYPNQLYLIGSTFFSDRNLARVISYLTILTEFGLGTWALTGKRMTGLVIFIHVFHLSMLILTVGELSYIFYYLMGVSSYLILPWKDKKGSLIEYPEKSVCFRTLRVMDFDHFFTWLSVPVEKKFQIAFGEWINGFFLHIEYLLFSRYPYGLFILTVVVFCMYKNRLLAFF